MLHIYSVLLLLLQIAKYKVFLIKIKVFIGFSVKLKVLKDFNKIKGFKGSPRGPVHVLNFRCIMQPLWLCNTSEQMLQ